MAADEHGTAGPVGSRRPGGALEAEILTVLHDTAQALTPGQVLERMDDALSYSTVVTVLSRMHGKGVLTRVKQGWAYAYAPVADAQGMTARRMREVLDSDPDREAVLCRFVDDLSADDEQLLRQLLGGDLPGVG
ncbi:BlaI/MecI/CopY family transcriptional regulator [Streptantibioticus rubrisoli]|uniref:BlaI/MecI/CopY family transcriptional regulator n=1 Tax=Streptantibioticus rubrisoli TaxID=1387313 RepID=A0ABT1PCS8_9ACTN|nr:BlaI/MecI/CopY family transcriptional regulator [Streptantibioticus rubrisoli]MCQ4042616.1 BlaI/MecI/CopY family transcriptional regulator [Streptantibioticus rubrisoli]